MKLKKNIQSFIFVILCLIACLLICSPLLIKIPVIHSIIHWFLKSFKTDDYKIVYIETIGSLIGTFLAITGALWTQRNIDKINEQEKLRKTAAIIYYDLKMNFDNFHQIMREVYPYVKSSDLSLDEEIIALFRKANNKKRVYFVPNWREMVIELQSVLSSKQTRELLVVYGKLSMISMSFNASVNERSKKEDMNAYSLLQSFFTVSTVLRTPLAYDYALKDEMSGLLKRLEDISQIQNIE